ncbi:uncharacterized protein LOC125685767 [Lagopus muta]|uniref:uncharacterized protein LOC125685767 n=1 Tax=Lagopus muta TaxID=64668 RepID=UPI00209D628B|nr:uncharacterized protein LOC125685767 [Lagopus muta]XP_048785093.1 uncharacterized protein LOC125685767 [Lagopus muta]XP_048785094.1 uncharacterized protein LOC125685767 [Lagopus muta]
MGTKASSPAPQLRHPWARSAGTPSTRKPLRSHPNPAALSAAHPHPRQLQAFRSGSPTASPPPKKNPGLILGVGKKHGCDVAHSPRAAHHRHGALRSSRTSPGGGSRSSAPRSSSARPRWWETQFCGNEGIPTAGWEPRGGEGSPAAPPEHRGAVGRELLRPFQRTETQRNAPGKNNNNNNNQCFVNETSALLQGAAIPATSGKSSVPTSLSSPKIHPKPLSSDICRAGWLEPSANPQPGMPAARLPGCSKHSSFCDGRRKSCPGFDASARRRSSSSSQPSSCTRAFAEGRPQPRSLRGASRRPRLLHARPQRHPARTARCCSAGSDALTALRHPATDVGLRAVRAAGGEEADGAPGSERCRQFRTVPTGCRRGSGTRLLWEGSQVLFCSEGDRIHPSLNLLVPKCPSGSFLPIPASHGAKDSTERPLEWRQTAPERQLGTHRRGCAQFPALQRVSPCGTG